MGGAGSFCQLKSPTVLEFTGMAGCFARTLTTGADNIIGTSNDDTVAGSVVFTSLDVVDSTSTYTVADTVNLGAATSDTFNLVVSGGSGAANALPAGLVTGIEILNIRNASAGAVSLNASTIAGLTGIYADRASAAVTLTNVADSATVGIKGNGTLTNGAFNFGYKTDTAAISLAIADGVTAGAITGNSTTGLDAATSATITSTGAANVVGVVNLIDTSSTLTSLTINAATNLKGQIAAETEGDFAASSTLTVTGAATTVELTGALANAITTVDASSMTLGGLKATLGTGAETVKGGAGVDTITLAAGVKSADFGAGDDVVTTTNNAGIAATAAGVITGGIGTDTLVVAHTGDVSTAAKRAVFTSFEKLNNATTSSIAADGFTGVSGVISSADGAGFSGLSAAQAANISVTASQSGGITYALTTATGTTDVLGITLGAGTTTLAATNILGGALTVTGFETLNVTANPGPSATVGTNKTSTIASLTGATLNKVNLAGTAVTITDAATIVAATFDASALTGDGTVAGSKGLTISGNLVTGSTVIGSNLIDTVSIGQAGSTYNTGLGNDSISAATQAILLGSVINGGAGIDTLTLTDTTGTVTVLDNSLTNVSGIEKLAFSAITGLNFAIGGYANALATANGGVLDITAASLNIAAGGVAVDATGLATGNSLKLSLTNASTAGAGTIAVTLSQGADNITINQSGAASGDAITISGGVTALASTTAKTIDLSNVTTGLSATITTGAGADIIKSAGIASTITAGKGGDTITLLSGHSGAQTLATASDETGTATATAGALTASTAIGASTLSFATTGMDIITNFAAGDKVQLYTTGTSAIVTSNLLLTGANTLGASTVGDVAIVRGGYNSGVFTASTTGTDSALIWDSNGTTTGGTYSAIVLVGYVDSTANDTISIAGLFTGV
jgi:hypothetical protein